MTELAVSAEFIRPGLVGGTEQALHYVLDGLGMNLSDDDHLAVVGDVPVDPRPNVSLVAPPRPMSVRFAQETLSFARLARGVDAYYFPNYFTPPVPGAGARVVTTIPDLQYVHLPDNFTRKKRRWLRAAHQLALRRADVVTAYTAFVRHDLLSAYGTRREDHVVVMPIPVSWERFGPGGESGRQRPYVLSVASHYAHKNLPTLVRAFTSISTHRPDLDLVLVGQFSDRLIGVRRADDVRALVASLGLDERVFTTGFIDVNELGDLYRHAELFVFPSVFEGFGLPPVEAMGFGLPVLTTRCASLPEVTLGLADYVDDPYDHHELAERMLQQLDSGTRPDRAIAARVRDHYAPDRIGRQLYELMTSDAP